MSIKHAGCDRKYICERCGKLCPSISLVSIHFMYCARKPPPQSPYQMEVGVHEPIIGTPLRIVHESTSEEVVVNVSRMWAEI